MNELYDISACALVMRVLVQNGFKSSSGYRIVLGIFTVILNAGCVLFNINTYQMKQSTACKLQRSKTEDQPA